MATRRPGHSGKLFQVVCKGTIRHCLSKLVQMSSWSVTLLVVANPSRGAVVALSDVRLNSITFKVRIAIMLS
jgi:hypothetical protein